MGDRFKNPVGDNHEESPKYRLGSSPPRPFRADEKGKGQTEGDQHEEKNRIADPHAEIRSPGQGEGAVDQPKAEKAQMRANSVHMGDF